MSYDIRPTPVLVAIDPIGAKKQLDSGNAYYLDVRTVEEFNEVHVATERIANIPYMFDGPNGWVKNDRFLEEVSAVFKKDDHLIVGDRDGGRGGRSEQAFIDLSNDGFKHAVILSGGIEAWLEKGLPVVGPTK